MSNAGEAVEAERRPGPQRAESIGDPTSERVREALVHGELTVHGSIPHASNAVLFGTVHHRGEALPCVYKPVAGERPLWDFPDGDLASREVAAFEVVRASGWPLIPATVLRDGPYGRGMCQAWVGAPPSVADEDADDADDIDDAVEDAAEQGATADAAPTDVAAGAVDAAAEEAVDEAEDTADPPLLALLDAEEPEEGWKPVGFADVGEGRTALLVHADHPELRRLAVLDAVLNNGDRKGGHLLRHEGRLLAIDHGVTFHTDDRLRTLLWGWGGEELTAEASEVLSRLAAQLVEKGPLAERLGELLTPTEVAAVRKRVEALRAAGRHPLPSGEWPPIPWPPV